MRVVWLSIARPHELVGYPNSARRNCTKCQRECKGLSPILLAHGLKSKWRYSSLSGLNCMDNATKLSIAALERIRRETIDVDGNGSIPGLSPTRSNNRPIVWPEPKPLPNGLLPVEPFSSEFMPDALGPWIEDIANRLQCPPDYVAVAALTALGSVIGRRIGIKPQAKTDWVEVPNVWGMFIGRPGMLKWPQWARL